MAKSIDEICAEYPNINPTGYEWISEEDDNYNCVAWAAGINDEIWQDAPPGYKWPASRRTQGIESLVEVFENLGFEQCEDSSLEDGYDKVALYARNRLWGHAARQLSDGRWTSKLGVPGGDIVHATPECVTCLRYIDVHCIMRRPIAQEGQ